MLAVAAYVVLAPWTRSRRGALGIADGMVVSADDSLSRAPTLHSARLGLVGRCDHLLRVGGAYVPGLRCRELGSQDEGVACCGGAPEKRQVALRARGRTAATPSPGAAGARPGR